MNSQGSLEQQVRVLEAALTEAVAALREVRVYVRLEAPHPPTERELQRVIGLCDAALPVSDPSD